MSRERLLEDIKRADRALDALAEAAFELSKVDDWVISGVADSQVIDKIMDEIGDRIDALRSIRESVDKIRGPEGWG